LCALGSFDFALEVAMLVRWIVWVLMFHFIIFGVAFGATEPSTPVGFSSSAMPMVVAQASGVRIARSRVEPLDLALYSAIASYRALDYVSTRRALRAGAQETELPQWVVDRPQTLAGFEALATVAEAGASVWLIRHGHRGAARTFNSISISLGTNTVTNNFRLASATQIRN
jgi:hypothetical protein